MLKVKVPWSVSKFKTCMNLLSNPFFKFPGTKKMIVVKKYQEPQCPIMALEST